MHVEAVSIMDMLGHDHQHGNDSMEEDVFEKKMVICSMIWTSGLNYKLSELEGLPSTRS